VTVKELIKALQAFPPDMEVISDEYIEYEPLAEPVMVSVAKINKHYWIVSMHTQSSPS